MFYLYLILISKSLQQTKSCATIVTTFCYDAELLCLLGDGKYYERVDIVPFQSTEYLTTPVSHFVDSILTLCLPSLPSYLKDSTDFIRDVCNLSIVPGSYLVTADVSSLYTNIPTTDCITSIDLFCRAVGCTCSALVMEFPQFVITNNYFEADGTLFHQKWAWLWALPCLSRLQ